jgi:hypothetical protein
VIIVELVFVGSFLLVAVTVTLVFWVTAGAVKFPVGSTVAPVVPLTDHTTPYQASFDSSFIPAGGGGWRRHPYKVLFRPESSTGKDSKTETEREEKSP